MTASERRAILFLAAVALLGGLVRAVRAVGAGADRPAGQQLALAAQQAAVDSAARGLVRPRARRGQAASGGKAKAKGNGKAPAPAAPAGPVDVDRADAATLVTLPRIGPVLAGRIVADRDSLGAFGSLERLERVRGIGPAMARSLAPHVTFSGTPRPLSAAPASPRGTRPPFHSGGPAPRAPARRSRSRSPRPTSSPTHARFPATWPSHLPRPPSVSATC